VLLFEFGKAGFINLPWSSGFLYTLLSCIVIVIYITISLGTEIPTSIILASFQRKNPQTFGDLTALFTDKGLIFARTDDLIQSKLVQRSGSRLTLTARGKIVWQVLEVYRRVFHRTLTE
jgi:cyanate permease